MILQQQLKEVPYNIPYFQVTRYSVTVVEGGCDCHHNVPNFNFIIGYTHNTKHLLILSLTY